MPGTTPLGVLDGLSECLLIPNLGISLIRTSFLIWASHSLGRRASDCRLAPLDCLPHQVLEAALLRAMEKLPEGAVRSKWQARASSDLAQVMMAVDCDG